MKIDSNFYLNKVKLEAEMDDLFFDYVDLLSRCETQKCKVCGVIPGMPLKGFDKYYCDHIHRRIDRKLKRKQKGLSNKMVRLFLFRGL